MTSCALICTRNGSERLPQTLRHLFAQEGLSAEEFSIVLLDNNSTDDTAEQARQLAQGSPFPLHILRDTSPGKWSAILSQFREGITADLITIVDDDNWLAPDFIARTRRHFEQHPRLGILGSQNQAVFPEGGTEPAWFKHLLGRYACSRPAPPIAGELVDAQISAGAGSTFRRAALLEALDKGYPFINDTTRHGNLWITGEDTEMCYVFAQLGWKFLYDENLSLQHVMYPARLEWAYARKLSRTIGTGAVGVDPFLIFAEPDGGLIHDLRATWQWQALAKVRRLLRFGPALMRLKSSPSHEGDLREIEMEHDYGALLRILELKGAYTQHLNVIREFIRLHPKQK